MAGCIVCAVDGSAGAREATRVASGLAGRLGARLVLVAVVRSLGLVPTPGFFNRNDLARIDGVRDDLRAEALGMLRRVAAEAGATGAELVVRAGDVADGVLDEAAARSATAIVVGSRGAGGVRRALRGSLSDDLSRRASCPVVVVPHAAVAAAAEWTPVLRTRAA